MNANKAIKEAVLTLAEESINVSVKYLVSSIKELQKDRNEILVVLGSTDSDTIKIRKINELLNSKK